jgi:hypothetical protein
MLIMVIEWELFAYLDIHCLTSNINFEFGMGFGVEEAEWVRVGWGEDDRNVWVGVINLLVHDNR